MRRNNKQYRDTDVPDTNLHVVTSGFDDISEVEEASDSDSEEDVITAPVLRKRSSRRDIPIGR